jgi:hypothetical protein
MKLTMRVHSLSLPIGTRSPQAQLYRVDDIKRRRESGWTDRITLHGTDLQLGDIVIVTVEKEEDHQRLQMRRQKLSHIRGMMRVPQRTTPRKGASEEATIRSHLIRYVIGVAGSLALVDATPPRTGFLVQLSRGGSSPQ